MRKEAMQWWHSLSCQCKILLASTCPVIINRPFTSLTGREIESIYNYEHSETGWVGGFSTIK